MGRQALGLEAGAGMTGSQQRMGQALIWGQQPAEDRLRKGGRVLGQTPSRGWKRERWAWGGRENEGRQGDCPLGTGSFR